MNKISKDAARYTPIAKGDDHCYECRHFERPNRCEKVDGLIASGGWCKLFSAKHSLAKAVNRG